jgi:hypothetical protein
MKQHYLTLNLLSQELQAEPESPAEGELAAAETSKTLAEDVAVDRVLTEATTIADTADASADVLEAAAEEDKPGADEATVEVAEKALEHFHQRAFLGPRKASTYSTSTPKARRETALKLGAEMRQVSKTVRGRIRKFSMGQEGFISNVKWKFSDLFASKESVLSKLHVYSDAFDRSGARTEPILEASWAKDLNIDGSGKITTEGVIKVASKIIKDLDEKTLIEAIKNAASMVDNVSKMNASWNPTDEMQQKLQKSVMEMSEINMRILADASAMRRANVRVMAEPVDPGKKDELVKLVTELLETKQLDQAIAELDASLELYYSTGGGVTDEESHRNTREDLIISDAVAITNKLYVLDGILLSFAHAVTGYIQASINADSH